MIHLDTATIIALAIALVIPAVSSLLSKVHWPKEVVGLITLALSALNGFLTEWAKSPSNFDWKSGLLLTVASFAIAIASRYGILKDTKLDAKLLSVGSQK